MKSKQQKKKKKVDQQHVAIDQDVKEKVSISRPKNKKKNYMLYLPEADTDFLRSHLDGSSLSHIISLLVQAIAKDVRKRIMPTNELYILKMTVNNLVEFLKNK